MAGGVFLWVLGGATVAAAIALLAVLFRRPPADPFAGAHRPRSEAARLGAGERDVAEPGSTWDAAMTGGAGKDGTGTSWTAGHDIPWSGGSKIRRAHRTDDDEEDLPKICPSCGLRYGHQFHTCQRDNSELATIH